MRKVTKPKGNESPETLGQRIAFERRKINVSQEGLADTLHIKRELMVMIENDTRKPKVEVLIDISKHLGVTTDYLLGLSPYENKVKVDKLTARLRELDGLSANQASTLLWSLGFTSERLKYVTDKELKGSIVSWLANLLQSYATMIPVPATVGLDEVTLAAVAQNHRDAIDCINQLDNAAMKEIFRKLKEGVTNGKT